MRNTKTMVRDSFTRLAMVLVVCLGWSTATAAPTHEDVRRSLFRTLEEEESWMSSHKAAEREMIERDLRQNDGEGCVNILIHYKHNHELVTFESTHAEARCCTQEEYKELLLRADVVLLEYDEDIVTPETFVSGSIPGFPHLGEQQHTSWGIDRVLGKWETLSPHQNGEWERTVNVCVVDSGVDIQHDNQAYEDEEDPMVVGKEFNVGNASWYKPLASAFHGTHVSGIICADNENGKGTSSVIKGCRNKIQLMVARVFDNRAMPSAKMSDVDLAVEWCAKQDAHVINLSLSSLKPSYNSMMIYRNIALNNKCLVVAAAGNRGPNERGAFPASYPDVISVGASDWEDRVVDFSQKGANLVAPGKSILSLSIDYAIVNASTGEEEIHFAPMVFSARPEDPIEAAICDCGFSHSPCHSCASSICIIERDYQVSVDTQVKNAEEAGCAGAIIFSEDDMNAYGSGYNFLFVSDIPGVYVNKEEGKRLKAAEGDFSISFRFPSYRVGDGTSHAAPHVSACIAILMGLRPSCGAKQVRRALEMSARPLQGREDLVGKGLVRLVEAYQALLEDTHCGDPGKATQFAVEAADDPLSVLLQQKAENQQQQQANDDKKMTGGSSRDRGSGLRGSGGNRRL